MAINYNKMLDPFEFRKNYLMLTACIFLLFSCDVGETTNRVKNANRPTIVNSIKLQHDKIPDEVNAINILEKSKSEPLNYYFTEAIDVNEFYSRYRGYLNQEDANLNTDKPTIEIQYKPRTMELIRVYYYVNNPSSMKITLKEAEPLLKYVGIFDSNASRQFRRNFKNIFQYSPNGIDSNRYENSKGLLFGIDHNLDLVTKDNGTVKDINMYACIINVNH